MTVTVWDALGGLAFVLGIAALMGVFRREPPRWGYPPHDQKSLLRLVMPPPRAPGDTELDSPAEQSDA